MRVAGLDGSKSGWVAVCYDGGELSGFGRKTIAEALDLLSDAIAIAIDIPIGFLDAAQPGGRECEKIARRRLGARASCVFSSPVRAALTCADYLAANQMNKSSSDYRIGLSKQSHALFPKMTEVDMFLRQSGQNRIFEVHPELCFHKMASVLDMQTALDGKKSFNGQLQRRTLLSTVGLPIERLMSNRRAYGCSEDDLIDAAAAAWTAWRKAAGLAECVPESPPSDSQNLRMEMWV